MFAFKIQNINRFFLISTFLYASLAISPSCVQAQAIRAGVIGATRSMYNAEIKGIKNRSKLVNTRNKRDEFRGRKMTAENYQTQSQKIDKNTQPIKSWPENNSKPKITQEGNLTSSESELNANGWQSF